MYVYIATYCFIFFFCHHILEKSSWACFMSFKDIHTVLWYVSRLSHVNLSLIIPHFRWVIAYNARDFWYLVSALMLRVCNTSQSTKGNQMFDIWHLLLAWSTSHQIVSLVFVKTMQCMLLSWCTTATCIKTFCWLVEIS